MKIDLIMLCSDNMASLIPLKLNGFSPSDKYQVKGITGLDAQDLFHTFFNDGNGIRSSAKLRNRELAIKVALNPDFSAGESYSTLRDNLYRLTYSDITNELLVLFGLKNEIKAGLWVSVTKIENDISGKEQDVVLTMPCSHPYLLGPINNVDVTGFNWYGFEVNDMVSTASHGFDIKLRLTRNSTYNQFDFLVNNVNFGVGAPFALMENDTIQIITWYDYAAKRNIKSVTVTNASGEHSLIGNISGANGIINWPIMKPGVNTFRFNTSELEVVHFKYVPTYLGV